MPICAHAQRQNKRGGAMSGIFSQVKEFDRDTLKSVETHITRADGKKVRHIGILEYWNMEPE